MMRVRIVPSGKRAMPDQFNIQQYTAAIRVLAGDKRVVDSPLAVLKIGQALQAVRDHVGPSRFQEWLADEFDWGQPAASNWMRSAAVFGQLVGDPSLVRFRRKALYELARGGVPRSARDDAVNAARNGKEITLPVAKQIIRWHLGVALATDHVANVCRTVQVMVGRIQAGLTTLPKRERRQFILNLTPVADALQQILFELQPADDRSDNVAVGDLPTLNSGGSRRLRELLRT
jgi:hypothetical protein